MFATSVAILVKFIGSFMLQLPNRSDREPSILYYRDLLFAIFTMFTSEFKTFDVVLNTRLQKK